MKKQEHYIEIPFEGGQRNKAKKMRNMLQINTDYNVYFSPLPYIIFCKYFRCDDSKIVNNVYVILGTCLL